MSVNSATGLPAFSRKSASQRLRRSASSWSDSCEAAAPDGSCRGWWKETTTPVTEGSFAAFANSDCSSGTWSQSDVRMTPVWESSRMKRVPLWSKTSLLGRPVAARKASSPPVEDSPASWLPGVQYTGRSLGT